MQASNAPAKIVQAFASSGSKTSPIPVTTSTPGAASLSLGFPPDTMIPLVSGGIPPNGLDFNGILYEITAGDVWGAAGGQYVFDATFASAIGGYPAGALVMMADLSGLWLCTTDNNSNNPDTTPVGWVPLKGTGVLGLGLSNINVTLTPPQYSRRVIVMSGALTGNVQVTFPSIAGLDWLVVNSTTGAYTLSVLTAGGTPLPVPQGQPYPVYCNGTNILYENNAAQVGVPGVAAIATSTTVNAGTDNTQIVTASTLKSYSILGFAFSAGVNGYVKFPSWLGGLVIQWGQYRSTVSEGQYTFAFPLTFPSGPPFVLIPTVINASMNSSADLWAQWDPTHTVANTGAIYIQWDGQPSNNADGYAWIAIGN